MKNKKLTYILLPLVILIWGAIVYKVLANYFENDSSSLNSKNDDITSVKISKTDTFSLMLNYSDPFLKEGVSVSTLPVPDYSQSKPVKQIAATVKEKKDNTIVTWPAIIYSGLIKNKLSNKTCSIIKINGAEHLMNVGDTYNDVTLIKIFKDSAIVQYKNIKKTIFK
jgi:hypothetical protein